MFVSRNGFKKQAPVVHPGSLADVRHSSAQTSLLQSGLKDPDIMSAYRRECETNGRRRQERLGTLMTPSPVFIQNGGGGGGQQRVANPTQVRCWPLQTHV